MPKETKQELMQEIKHLQDEIIALIKRAEDAETTAEKYNKIRNYMRSANWICFDSPDEGETESLEMIKELEESEAKALNDRNGIMFCFLQAREAAIKIEVVANALARMHGHRFVNASNVIEPFGVLLHDLRQLVGYNFNVQNQAQGGHKHYSLTQQDLEQIRKQGGCTL